MKDRQKQKERSRQKKPHWHSNNNSFNNKERSDRDKVKREAIKQKQKMETLPQINRSQVCPFLARIYYSINDSNIYEKDADVPKERQLILYLWMNSTLKEITQLLRAHLPAVRTKQRFVFSRVSIEDGKYSKKQMGTVMVHKKGTEKEESRLDENKFCIGDLIDVSINFK